MSLHRLPLLFDILAIDTLPVADQQAIWQIDAVLPQTQCGLCGHRDGCLPYAHAIVTQNEATNLCVPGGDEVASQIAHITNRPPKPAMPSKWSTNPHTNRPQKMLAVIDESACIGCTKCLVACPVDAIIGTAKHMHAIVPQLCTGCELCLAPCPVDCIHMSIHHQNDWQSDTYREQYYAHLNRLAQSDTQAPTTSPTQTLIANIATQDTQQNKPSSDMALTTIEQAKLRTQIKKLTKQLDVRFDEQKAKTLHALKQQLAHLS